MKKRLFTIFLAVLLSFALGIPFAHADKQDFWATVYKFDGKYNSNGTIETTKVSTGITYKVLATGSDTAETLYAYGTWTIKTNPITTTIFASDGAKIAFACDPTDVTNDRYVDLIVTDTVGGYSALIKNFDKYTHSVVIDARPNIVHHGVIWYTCSTTDETDTGIDFVADTFVHDVRSEVVTTGTGATINVGLLSTGTGGDADGFLAARSIATAGFTADTGVITAGSTDSYTAASTYGALLYKAITGTGNLTGSTQGGRSYLGHVVTGTNTGALTYTCSTTDNTGAGYIHYWISRMR